MGRSSGGWRPGANFAAGGVERAQLEREVEEGRAAAERFVTANLGLVVAFARRYQATGVPLDDLIQEGAIGLLRAVERYDGPARLHLLDLRGVVNPPGHPARRARHTTVDPAAGGSRSWLAWSTGRGCSSRRSWAARPATPEISLASGLTPARVEAALGIQRHVVSLDAASEGSRPLNARLHDPTVDAGHWPS